MWDNTSLTPPCCRLRELRDNLTRDEGDVNKILDSPVLHHYLESHTPSPVAAVVHSKAEMVHMRCQGVAERLDDLIRELSGKIDQRREGIIKDLDGLEEWLGGAYSLVLLEPNRMLYQANLVDEGQLKPPSEGSSEEGEWQSPDVSGGSEEALGGRGMAGGEEEGCGTGGVAVEDREYSVQFSISEEREVEEEGLKDQLVNVEDGSSEERVNGVEEQGEGSDGSPSQTTTANSGEEKSTSEETGG